MNPIIKAVGELLYNNRMENGLSSEEMAIKCKTSTQDYCGFENGSIAIPLHSFIEICRICRIDPLSFIQKFVCEDTGDLFQKDIEYCFEDEIFDGEHGTNYTAYNVIVKQGNTILTRFSDVFLNKEAAGHFVDTCNRLSLDPMHVADVIDDVILK